MKGLNHFLSFGLSFGLGSVVVNPSLGLAQTFDPPSMIEVGAGTGYLGSGQPLEALIRVDVTAAGASGGDTYFVVAKLTGDALIGSRGNSFIDMEFELFSSQNGVGDNFDRKIGLLAELKRNIAIGEAGLATVSVLGYRMQRGGKLDQNAEGYIRAAFDGVGIGLISRTDGNGLVGISTGGGVEFGVKLFKKLHIDLGEHLDLPTNIYLGSTTTTTCDSYYDGDRKYYNCDDSTTTYWAPRAFHSDTYLNMVFDLTDSIKIFGKAMYQAYGMDTDSAGAQGGGGWVFYLGLGGSF